jgi:hypothetical protein
MSCCCGGVTGRGCFELQIDNITVSNASCAGFDSSIDGIQMRAQEWKSADEFFFSDFSCTVPGRAGLSRSDIQHWTEVSSDGIWPSAVKSSSSQAQTVCQQYVIDDFYCFWGNCIDETVMFLQDTSNFLHIFVIEHSLARGGSGDIRRCSSDAFHHIKSTTAHSDLSDLAGMNALSWTDTFYPYIDKYGEFTGWNEYFDPVMDFSLSTYTFTGCNQCLSTVPYVVLDTRENIDETLGKFYRHKDRTARTAAEMSALYFGTKPSDFDLLTSVFVSMSVPNGLTYHSSPAWDLYLGSFNNAQFYIDFPEFIGNAQTGRLSITYSGGGYTGPTPGSALGATQNAWTSAVATGPLSGSSRTVSETLSENTFQLQDSDTDFYREDYAINKIGLGWYNNSNYITNKPTTFGYRTDTRVSGLKLRHKLIHLNAHEFVPVTCNPGTAAYGYEGLNAWQDPPSPYPDCYYTSASFFENGQFDSYFTSDRRPAIAIRNAAADFTLPLAYWLESSLIFAIAETSDGSNWNVYPAALIQTRMPLFSVKQDCYDPFGYCKAKSSGLECNESLGGDFADRKYNYHEWRGCEPENDKLSSRYESRCTYTVAIASTPVAVASDSASNAVTKALQGYSGSLTNWTAPVNFGITGYANYFGGGSDRNAFDEWRHIPPAHGNSVFNAYSSISIDIDECDGINPCLDCKCPRLVDLNLPCIDNGVQPLNNLTNGGNCWQELKDKFMQPAECLEGCEPTSTCEGCTSSNVCTVTIGGVSNNFCTGCAAVNTSYVLSWNTTPQFLTADPTYGAICAGWSATFSGSVCSPSPTTETYIEVIVQEGGYIQGKICVSDALPSTCGAGADFDLTFTPGDYSPGCSISASLNQVSTTSGFCDFAFSTFSMVVS